MKEEEKKGEWREVRGNKREGGMGKGKGGERGEKCGS